MWPKLVKFLKANGPIILILLVAVIFRFYKLGSIPPGLHPDEAANGQDVIRMIQNHDFRAIYDTNGPREALFLYLQGIFVFLGAQAKWTFLNFTPLSLRIAPAVIGVFTVWGTYLFGKELFKSKNVGLFAAAALAVSSWHVQFSRNGFRAIMAPLALVFLFFYFIKAYREGKIKDYLWTGAWLAIGFYTYLSFRMVPLIFMALLGYIFFANKKFIKENLKKIGWMAVVFLILMVPMFIHFYHVPADMLGRSSTSIMNSELNDGNPLGALAGNIIKTMGMFNFKGDANWRHNVAGLPMLDPLMSILFWIGLVISLWNFRKIEHFILIMWFGAMSLPEVLTAEGIPHALRMVGVIPVVFLWVALGLNWLFEKRKIKEAAAIGTLVILIFGGTYTAWKYFVKFPTAPEAGEAYAEDMVNIADNLNYAPAERRNILIVGEYGTKTIDFITHSTNAKYERYEARDINKIKLQPGEYVKIFVQKDWIDEANRELPKIGFLGKLEPAESEINNQVLYYAYPNIIIKFTK